MFPRLCLSWSRNFTAEIQSPDSQVSERKPYVEVSLFGLSSPGKQMFVERFGAHSAVVAQSFRQQWYKGICCIGKYTPRRGWPRALAAGELPPAAFAAGVPGSAKALPDGTSSPKPCEYQPKNITLSQDCDNPLKRLHRIGSVIRDPVD